MAYVVIWTALGLAFIGGPGKITILVILDITNYLDPQSM